MSTTLHVRATLLVTTLVAGCGSNVPARIVTVDGQDIELATDGTGGAATVVFEAGLGDDWTSWDDVASQVARHSKIFAYSRPGYGASSLARTPRDALTIVEELRSLLAREGYTPPYVLVGHSVGGAYMELFAKAHPDEVAGVVLVDSRHRNFLAACEEAKLDNCGIPEDVLDTQGASARDEYHAFSLAADEIHAAGAFGTYPVRVLTATDHPVSPAREQLWETMLAELAAEASNGQQIVVHGAGHFIQLDRPDVVISSILEMLPTP
ncbi:MAG: alpha/beta hydrolase [Kofleriaceae bacterium]